ncbi:MAG: hypothetical protein GY855_03365, partial [candidate division Zixibacteria bacterium]|nr:hypothetical protein [candidate division Zixibacteria bacterium]
MFVPNDFEVPKRLSTDRFLLRMLSASDVVLDYDAVMSSRSQLRHVFAEFDDWPAENMTIEENLDDLQRHEKEFKNREAFAYTVMNLAEDKCLGCLYINPSGKKDFDA